MRPQIDPFFADSYLQALTSNGAHQIVTKPAKVTARSSTVIDHIITNDITHTIAPRFIRSTFAFQTVHINTMQLSPSFPPGEAEKVKIVQLRFFRQRPVFSAPKKRKPKKFSVAGVNENAR